MRLAFLAPALLAATVPTRAQDVVPTGTLKDIAARGAIRLGVRTGAVPFSCRNKAGQPVGFSVDLCHGIAADVAAALNRDLVEPDTPAWQTGVRVAYVPVAADERLPMVRSGAIDVECGSTTDTAERAQSVAFSPVFFLAGTKLLAAPPVPPSATRAASRSAPARPPTPWRGASPPRPTRPSRSSRRPTCPPSPRCWWPARSTRSRPTTCCCPASWPRRRRGHRFRVVGDVPSFEPYALPFRRDDPDFSALVGASFARMARDGVLAARYRRWFLDRLPDGEDPDLPMSAQLTETYQALGQLD